MTTPTLDIKLQGRAYSVACPDEEREALQDAASYLDAKMTESAAKTRSTGERLAVMVALNLAHELLALKKTPVGKASAGGADSFDTSDLKRRIRAMEARLDEALSQQEGLF